ncbi:MAG: phage portal protein [Candidatus Methanomethylophilaceae archaeon]|nr:phage portal protein [Candidatus Methanomethylophilaceae archaeon]MBR1452730.1 phage portal protein [Candidatus Methanomethylophilaceae archaeon]
MEDIIRTPTEITPKSLLNAYNHFIGRLNRLMLLDRAYDTGQVAEESLPCVSNYCKYISDTKSSYVAGNPPQYTAAEGDEKAEQIVELFRRQTKEEVDQKLVSDASIYGRAFEVCYCEEEDGVLVPKSAAISPLHCFVAYDFSLNPDSVFGAVHYEEKNEDGTVTHYLDVYDKVNITRYKLNSGSFSVIIDSRPHGFDRVPIIEYRNNPTMRGDFEPVMSLQNAINRVLSDRVKDKTRFANAVLMAKGVSFGDDEEEVEENMGKIKDFQYISIPKDADLSYLVKTFDEASVQILMDDIKADLHKISRIPDLSDQAFASNSSGVAIKFKLQGLNNLAQSLVAQFNKAFKRRCKLFSYVLFGSVDAIEVESMRLVFRFDIPADIINEANALNTYIQAGILSRRTAMENCPYVEDVAIEEERIEAEKDSDLERSLRSEMDPMADTMSPEDEDVEEETD